ncbi:MAG: TIR domain-containing protein [Lachnospiraceae bacterium]|jgi:serine/threonine protein kinase
MRLEKCKAGHFYDAEKYDACPHCGPAPVFGVDLPEYRKQKKLSMSDVLSILEEVMKAVVTLHRKNLLHLNINPTNILIDDQGNVMLGDVSSACTITQYQEKPFRRGTPKYYAPEMFYQTGYSGKEDMYSLGITMYYIVSGGNYPYVFGEAETRRADSVYLEDSTFPEWLNQMIKKATAYHPGDRYENMEEMLAVFRRMNQRTDCYRVPPLSYQNPSPQMTHGRMGIDADLPSETDCSQLEISKVHFSAVAPKTLEKEEYSLIDIVMFEDAFRSVVDDLIRDAEVPVKETRSGTVKVKEGAKVRIQLSSPDFMIDDDTEEQEWQREYLIFRFAVMLPEEFTKKQVLFTAVVYINDVIASRLKFTAKCSSFAQQKITVTQEDVLSAFVSYASQDRQRVAMIIQGMKKARPDMDIFFDVESLRSGESWEDALWTEIDRRDTLFLCWSHYAKESQWVEKEWRYALDHKGVEAIEPIPLEPPSNCPPPNELSKKHFNDRLLYVIQMESENIISKKKAGNEAVDMYEGSAPYMFISYSHQDTDSMTEICNVLRENGVRFWYDNGLHSGDDWNLVIASHLEKSSVCLLLLSRAAASSDYVKNELNFAMNHRIPIHVVLLESFDLPIDVEMMLGRIQMVEKKNGYEQRLTESLPDELFDFQQPEANPAGIHHPLFQIGDEIANRQGTVSYLGTHKKLAYEILVQVDHNINVSKDVMLNQAKMAVNLSHPMFPKIYDIMVNNGKMYTFQEYRGEIFLDQYLKDHRLQEEEITKWISSVINAMDYLFFQNLGFRDFARGSLVVTRDRKLGFTRLQNHYYGVMKLQMENRQYYFEKEVEEIAVLLYQLCTGRIPILPFDMISSQSLSKSFVDKVNLILQKSTKEGHKIKYNTFGEILQDLHLRRLTMGDALFLRKRQEKLKEYESIRKANLNGMFTGSEKDAGEGNLEEKFGFEATVQLTDEIDTKTPVIRVRICSTGQILESSKGKIIIGRAPDCDLVLKQPSLSRRHVLVRKQSEDEYVIEDLNTTNGTFIAATNEKIQFGQTAVIPRGGIIQLGSILLQLC